MDQVERLRHNLSLQRPRTPNCEAQLDTLRAGAISFGSLLLAVCDDNRERSLALTNLEQALQWAIGSVVRYQEDE